jgi:hypothetical protein
VSIADVRGGPHDTICYESVLRVARPTAQTGFTAIYSHRASTARHAAWACRADTTRLRASRVIVPAPAMGQAIGPRHGTRAKFP